MSLHQGIDFSRFKRVRSDAKSTTLRHVNGHELTVAHKPLTPKMREALDALEEHEEGGAVKRYAGGTPRGVVVEDDETPPAALDPASPEPVTPEAAGAPPSAEAPAPVAVTPKEETPQAPNPQVVPKPAVMPQAGTVDVVAPPPKTPQVVAQEMTQHDLDFQKDMQMGHIKPETYQSLYAKKDTLGKIGTLFGLLVSGAGSGLTHQPNAVLQMMDNQIKNDLEAQQKNQGSDLNWYTATKNHELQKAQMEQMNVQNLVALQGTQKIPAEIENLKAEARSRGADVGLKNTETELNRLKIDAYKAQDADDKKPPASPDLDLISRTSALNKARMAAVQSLQDQANKIPPGPQKEAYQKALDLLSQGVQVEVAKSNLETAARLEARSKLRPAEAAAEDGGAHDPGFDMDKFQKLVARSRNNENIGIKGKVTEADINEIKEEGKQLAANREAARQYKKAFEKISSMGRLQKLNPELYKSQVAAAKTEISKALTGAYSPSQAEEIAESAFPSWKDFNHSGDAKFQTFMGVLEGNESKLLTLDRFGLRKPFPFKKGKAEAPAGGGAVAKTGGSKYPEGAKKNGFVVSGGKWVPDGATKQATK